MGKVNLLVGGLAAATLILTMSCVSKDYTVTETYYETELRQESYVVSERYVTEELCEKSEVLFEGYTSVPEHPNPKPGYVVLFSIERSDAILSGIFEGPMGTFHIRTSHHPPAGKMIYEDRGGGGTFEISPSPGDYYAAFLGHYATGGGKWYLVLTLEWTELQEVIKHREVTKYHEVPVQVEKQRTVTKTEKVPFWELLFSE